MENSGELIHVPEDITGEILRHLPVKSLLRFQCVCKSWWNLINSAEFVESHRNDINRRPRAIFFKSGLRDEYENDPDITKMKMCKIMRAGQHYRIDGHSNGIICLTLKSRMGNRISLWNPALRQRRILPPASGAVTADHLYVLGFGYDRANRDYKVVSVPLENERKPGEMYSLKSDSWKPIHCDHLRSIEDEFFDISDRGCSFKGRLYWIVCRGLFDDRDSDSNSNRDSSSDSDSDSDSDSNMMFLVVFDLTGEKFLEFDIPESVHNNNVNLYYLNLGVFKGRLSWLRENSSREYEIWSSEDDSCAPEFWTRAWKFSPEALQLNNRLEVCNVELIGDESMLVNVKDRVDRYGDSFIYLYDFQMNGLKVRTRARDYRYGDEHLCVPITNFVETLFPVIRKPPRRRRGLPAIRITHWKRKRKSSLSAMP